MEATIEPPQRKALQADEAPTPAATTASSNVVNPTPASDPSAATVPDATSEPETTQEAASESTST